MECGSVEIRPHNFVTLKTKTLRFRNSLSALLVYYYNMCTSTRLFFLSCLAYPTYLSCEYSPGGGGGVLELIFARYVPHASQSPYPIIVYFVAN